MHIWSGANGPVPALLRARYYTFHNIVYNMNSPYKARITSSKWRSRGADKWRDIETDRLPPQYTDNSTNENSTRFNPEALQAADVAMNELRLISEKSLNNTTKL